MPLAKAPRWCIGCFSIIVCLMTACAGGGKPDSLYPTESQGLHRYAQAMGFYEKGCYTRALREFLAAHELFSAGDDQRSVAMCLNSIANCYRFAGDTPSALLFFDDSIRIYDRLQIPNEQIRVLANRAAALVAVMRLDEAATSLDQATTLAGDSPLPVTLLSTRGVLLTRQGAYQEAEESIRQAIVRAEPDNLTEIATAQAAMGNLMAASQRPAEALSHFSLALAADRKKGFFRGMADDLAALAVVHEQMNQPRQAVDCYRRSIKIYALLGEAKQAMQLMPALEAAARLSGENLDVTRHFVQQWLAGDAVEGICR